MDKVTKLTPFFIICLAAGFATYIYSYAWSGGWYFDDHANLSALLKVYGSGNIDWAFAFEFVFSGDAGPLGRPISLASFLIDGSTWPGSPGAMLYTNSLLHAMNALLLCGLWLAVLRQRADDQSRNCWIAIAAAALWLIQPLLASGVLMAVQRMTLLSSSFMLLGIWLYVLGRERIETKPIQAWILILFGVLGGTLLGVFSKEQAVILPLLLWTLERWILRPPKLSDNRRKCWVLFRCCAFYVPAIVIFIYLARIAFNHEANFAGREFSIAERIFTESIILWDYLRLVILPRALDYGPFHDDYPVYSVGIKSLVALLSWFALLLAFWLVRGRSGWPLFALLWFMVAHVVESTVVPLELYFEHRNYLALAGPLLALVVMLESWSSKDTARKRFATLFLIVYGVSTSFILWQVTSMFGQSELAARLWYERHPNSIRASQYLAGKLSESGDVVGALKVLDEISERQRSPSATRLQGLQLACVLNAPRDELEYRFKLVLADLSGATARFSINDPLSKLKILMEGKACDGFLTVESIMEIANVAASSPGFKRAPLEVSNLHFFMAMLYVESRNLDMSMRHMEAAMQAVPQLLTLKNMVALLGSAGLYYEAYELFDRYPVKWARNPLLATKQKKEWYNLKQQVAQKIDLNGDEP